jgi:GT2 family glycosyltransferase
MRRLRRNPLRLLERQKFDEQFFLAWNPSAATCPGGAFQEYLSNWYPTPRKEFKPGELVENLLALKALAANSSQLRLEADTPPKVSIVIPVYNQLRITLRCLRSVLAAGAKESFEVIVVDDCSAGHVSKVLSQAPGIRYVCQPKNGGFISSCNLGASVARGEYLVFLNNDTHTLSGWLDELLATFTIRPQAGLVGSQLIYPNGILQEAGAIMWRDGSGWNYGRSEQRYLPQFNYLRPVDWCSGASIMVPRTLFNELGQFDAHYSPAYAEDVDLAFKIRKAGYEVLYQPCSKVVHFEGVSSGTDTSSGIKAYQVINLKKFYERWKPTLAGHGAAGVRPDIERDRGITKRVLIIDSVTPTPDCDAGSLVAYQFMKIFLKLGYGVTFIPAHNLQPDGKYTQDLQRIGVECWHYPFISSVDEYLQEHGDKFDVVFLYRVTEATRHLAAVRAYAPQAKVIFNTVDLHFLRAERQAKIEQSLLRRIRAAQVKVKELRVMKKTEATILLNRSEVELISKIAPSVKTFMLPLTQEVTGSQTSFSERKDIVFIGGFRHLPNVDAVKYFCSEIMPLVREKLPGVRFIVVGSMVPDELKRYACDDVEIRGFVENLGDIFDHCRMSVAPLRYGAGMKGKIVTSLSYGVPCVTTTIGTEGMGLSAGENITIANDPSSYAQAIVDIYTSEPTWTKLSEASVSFAKQNFSVEVVEQQIRQMMAEIGV